MREPGAGSGEQASINLFPAPRSLLPAREDFAEQFDHRRPGLPVRGGVVRQLGHAVAPRIRIREAVLRAGIAHHLEARARGLHLLLERLHLLRRYERIDGTRQDQETGLDLAGLRRGLWGERAMERDDGVQV